MTVDLSVLYIYNQPIAFASHAQITKWYVTLKLIKKLNLASNIVFVEFLTVLRRSLMEDRELTFKHF